MPISVERIASGHRNQFRGEKMMGQELHKMGYNIPLPRVELPTFKGENPRGWLQKCRKYFKLNIIPANQWVEVVSYYLEGKTDVCFISGLKEDIKPMLKILKPVNVLMAFEQARWQEESNNALTRRFRPVHRSNTIFNNGRVASNAPSTVFSANQMERGRPRSNSLFEQRKTLRQSFKCGDKYTPRHRCSTKGLHMIEGVKEEEDEEVKELDDTMQDECKERRSIDEFGLSLNALVENDTYNTIRIKGNCQDVEEDEKPTKAVVEIESLLKEFVGLFEEPQTLPPARKFDHKILLKAGLLVKKKDNTWRFYIDYRQLNKKTIKNKFPIPLIDNLLDELHGSRFFSKLDLVMPFGLTNALATFQALMNSVLEPFLQKFVLVFFNDILIYSSTFELHLAHLRQVLEKLKANQLFAKKSKYAFEEQQEFRGFLGLAGYYRKFIRHFGIISKPLTDSLKKNNFGWSIQAQQAFTVLKQALCEAPVLTLLDFFKTFVLETNACDYGLGAVLSQEGKPVAYFSKSLSLKHLGLSLYEKEYLAILMVVEKKGRENIVVGALSRKTSCELSVKGSGTLEAITNILPAWYEDVYASYEKDCKLQAIILNKLTSAIGEPDFTYKEGILRYKVRIVVGQGGHLRAQLVAKVEKVAYPGLLQPLPVPGGTWEAITMDFIEGLPSSEGQNAILVVADRFIKYGHFIAFTAQDIAQVVLDHFYKFHGLHAVIFTDRDKIFTSVSWKELIKKLGVRMLMCTAYHPQTDGQTERPSFNMGHEPFPGIIWLCSSSNGMAGTRTYSSSYGGGGTVEEGKHGSHTEEAAGNNKEQDEPYRQNSVAVKKNLKLNPRYYSPFQTSKRIGMVAYELKLLEGSLIHPVFHVSLLKKKVGDATIVSSKLPILDKEGRMQIMSLAILDRKLMKKGNGAATAVLVQWTNLYLEDATWEDMSDL
ncbi:uncharacterized protein [Populus alba]|uniref:uncharacterized protein n=1 Tax=Populus alba TaxID=43335 RepID=UPI003CC740D1